VESAVATFWLIERDDALIANRRENGLVRPDRSEVLGQLIGTGWNAISGKLGFCRGVPGKLVLTVKNQGAAPAGASHMTVKFGGGTSVSVNTPTIPAGGSVDLLVAIPNGCFQSDCPFEITVDSALEVVESDETNNVDYGYCLG
jgi:hypothetical protein